MFQLFNLDTEFDVNTTLINHLLAKRELIPDFGSELKDYKTREWISVVLFDKEFFP